MKQMPWWMAALAAAFFAYFALLVYCDLRRPTELGIDAGFIGGRLTIQRVTRGSPAERGGLAAGDVIATANGKAIRDLHDLQVVFDNLEFDRPIEMRGTRGDTALAVALQPPPEPWSYWRSGPAMFLLGVLGVQLVSLVLALVIATKRPHDTIARLGAWTLASAGVYTIVLPYRIASVWRAVPWPAGVLLLLPYTSALASAAVFCTFFMNFPRAQPRRPIVWLGLWAPMAFALAKPIQYAYQRVYAPLAATGSTWEGQVLTAVSAAYILAGLAALWVNYSRLVDVNERRRVKVLVIGAIAGLTPGFLLVASFWMESDVKYSQSVFASQATALGTLALLVFPASFAYAILRHRLFDVSVIIRQGVRYALARRVLVSLVPLLAAALVIDVALHADRPLSSVLQSRGWAYGIVGALAVLAHWRRHDWLSRLDRRFFREHYDAQQILRYVAEDVRRVGDFDRVAPRVVAQIDAALHPKFVTLLVRDPQEVEYRRLAAMPPGFATPTLRVDSTLVALLRLLGKPIEMSAGGVEWLDRQLPRDEVDLVRRSGIELLVPIVTNAERAESVVALGVKRSEEPYMRQDIDLLAVIAANLAMLLERPTATAEQPGAAFDECPDCGACYDSGTGVCASDGVRLTPVPLSRLLASRYQLDRRLGSGGLGAVYAATDTTLDRRVAVKVIRHDLVTNDEVARRFQREARIAAAFVHPNVVTVHDFGVTAGGRAFLVMELLTGSTLRETLDRRGPLAAAETVSIMTAVCSAIDAAHRRQLVHRDLKPENIFLVRSDAGETTKVLDFGIAKVLATADHSITQSGTGAGILVGTVQYMAPEQLRGEDVQPAWDVWALAVIAYEMLTGSHPFAGLGSAARGHDAATALVAEAGAERFFAGALAVDPAGRPPSPAAFLSDLTRALRTHG